MNEPIRLLLNGQSVEVSALVPTTTLLTWLRVHRALKGSKEGCGEGDCGACTVVVAALVGERDALQLRTINACIQLVPSLDGKAVFTVEYLQQLMAEVASREATGHGGAGDSASPGGNPHRTIALHPVQQAMVDHHGSQCGFCTPGFVMSLWQLYESCVPAQRKASKGQVASALTGNLCRCTGYRPILDAGEAMFDAPPVLLDRQALRAQLQQLRRSAPLDYQGEGAHFHAPHTVAQLASLRAAKPQATLLAGCTDVGLWINKQFREVGDLIYTPSVQALHACRTEGDGSLTIGAGVSLTDAYAALTGVYPELVELWERFASTPVRNAGTLGGNIANGSPIGDSAPALIALGAKVVLASQRGERTLALEDFYLDYMKKDMAADEFVLALQVPGRPGSAQTGAGLAFRTYKISKRFDSDISAVCAAFALQLEPGGHGAPVIRAARIAFGGMAATSRRARLAEGALIGQPWSQATADAAGQRLAEDYAPLSDMRATARYRQRVAANMLQRFFLETRADQPLPAEAVSVYAGMADAQALAPVACQGDAA